MKTVGEARIWLKENLKNSCPEEELPEILFLLLNFVTQLSQTQLHAFPEKELSEAQIQVLLLSAQKLQSKMPVQYVLGEAEFLGLKLKVNSSVLIPRPETEELVLWILDEKLKDEGEKEERGAVNGESKTVLDIGTGSGCIPIAIKKNWPEANVFGLDISAEALQTAKNNALLNQVEIHFFQQDILNFMPVKEASRYSIIISNPPYISPKEQLQMHHNVLAFEPHLALFIPENDPLLFYRTIAYYTSFTLQKNGLLFFEVNENYGKAVVDLLKSKNFTDVELRKDLGGKDRMVRAVKV